MRWYSYLVGYCVVKVISLHPERLINMALSRGIMLWDIENEQVGVVFLKVRVASYKALRILGRRCGCKIKIVEKSGWPFVLGRLKKRKVLVVGTLFFCLSLYILGSFVWFVEIEGNEKVVDQTIITELAKIGIKPGVVKYGINYKEVEEKLLERMPQLAWVGIRERGTKLTIEIAEKVLIPEVDNRPANLIARTDGVIEEILVLQGVPQVQEQQKVAKGQLVVSGLVYPYSRINDDGTIEDYGDPQYIRAKAIIKARVFHIKEAEWPLVEEGVFLTGKKAVKVAVIVANREIVLRGPKESPFPYYIESKEIEKPSKLKEYNFPVELIITTFMERQGYKKVWGPEHAYKKAQEKALEMIKEEMTPGSKIIHSKAIPLAPENYKNVRAQIIVESLEEIGQPLLIK